jgi:esterase/lipase superfamily enzyme
VDSAAKQMKALVLAHGFDNRFDEGVYLLSQIVHNSKARMIPLLFT